MKAKVVFASEFRSDLLAQTRRLLKDDRREWAERLIDEVALVARLLGTSPQAGVVEVRRQGREVRRLVMGRLPFVVWYHFKARSKKVVVLRLFHVRQRR